jgi:hypothetical protein
MHINVNQKNKITSVHIERWDKDALPDQITDDLMGFEDCTYEQEYLLSYLFKKQLFKYVRILIIHREGRTSLICWFNSPLYGNLGMNSFLINAVRTNSSVAFFVTLDTRDLNNLKSFESHDTFLNPILNIPGELIMMDTEEFSIEDLFESHKMFEMCRNVENAVTIVQYSGPDKNKAEKIRQKAVREDHFSMLDTKNVIHTFPISYIKENIETMTSYSNFMILKNINSITSPEALEVLAKIIILKNKGNIPTHLDLEITEQALSKFYKQFEAFDTTPIILKKQILYYYYEFYRERKSIKSGQRFQNSKSIHENIEGFINGDFAFKIQIFDTIPKMVEALNDVKKAYPKKEYDSQVFKALNYIKYGIPPSVSGIKRMIQKITKKPIIKDMPELDQFIK